MARVLTVTPRTSWAKSGEECYEIYWIIPNWRELRKSEDLVKSQEAVFETGSSPSALFKTEWLVGLKLVPEGNSGKKVQLYWKLLEIHGSPSNKVEAELHMQLINSTGCYEFVGKKTGEVKELEVVEGTHDHLQFKPDSYSTDANLICLEGTVGFRLLLTLKKPTMSHSEYDSYKMKQFSKSSLECLRRDQISLLYDDPENADLKFIASDNLEIMAHKTILRARCPVFAAMLNCDLSENATGIIRLTDITGKTMNIVLHYFYARELLPSWRDPDTIVEFTYAADKYQMTEVLELLDDMLGRNSEGDASNLDVQLINLAGKLELVNAEARLLKNIVAKIKKLTSGDELFRLFGFDEEEISEMVDNLSSGQVGQSRILRLMDSMFDSIDNQELYEKGMPLLAFVQKEELKRMEKNLLKRFADLAGRMGNANQLLTLFCRGK